MQFSYSGLSLLSGVWNIMMSILAEGLGGEEKEEEDIGCEILIVLAKF